MALWRNSRRQQMVDSGELGALMAEALQSLQGAVVQATPPPITGTASGPLKQLLVELDRLGVVDDQTV
jgi:hypothetical protein